MSNSDHPRAFVRKYSCYMSADKSARAGDDNDRCARHLCGTVTSTMGRPASNSASCWCDRYCRLPRTSLLSRNCAELNASATVRARRLLGMTSLRTKNALLPDELQPTSTYPVLSARNASAASDAP